MKRYVMGLALLAVCAAQIPALAATAAVQPKGEGGVTLPELRTMLENMGYEVQDAGPKHLRIKERTSALNVPISFNITSSGSKVWLQVHLDDRFAEFQTPEKLMQVLEYNWKVGTARFSVLAKTGDLWMTMPFDNRHVTPQLLRTEISEIAKSVLNSRKVWDRRLQTAKTPAAVTAR